MTIAETHVAVKLGLDKTSSLELPAFEPEELDFWINKGISKFIDVAYKTFEETQSITESIKTLVEEDIFATYSGSYGNANKENCYTADIFDPSVYRYALGEEVNIVYLDSISNEYKTKRQGVTEASQESYRHFLDNPFSEHRLHYDEAKPLRLFVQNYVELISDENYSVTDYIIRYLRNPATVSLSGNVDCDLPSHVHHKIVDIVVSMLLENIESSRHQEFENKRMMLTINKEA